MPLRGGFSATGLVIGCSATSAPGWSMPAPCVIHFARFELGFLEDLHRRFGEGPFPLDIVCLHEVARRLFPELPRRNIRALAGYLGHSPELVRRSAGHVEASAFIWRAVLPALESAGVRTVGRAQGLARREGATARETHLSLAPRAEARASRAAGRLPVRSARTATSCTWARRPTSRNGWRATSPAARVRPNAPWRC